MLCVGAEVATEPRPLTGYIRQRLKSLVQQLAEYSGYTSNSEPMAATAARAFARPRGAIERSEIGASEIMAERMGFEPTRPFWSLLP